MAQLNTIPAESAPLTAAPQSKMSLKSLVAGAAVASFVLGLMAATAVTSAAAPRAPAAFMAPAPNWFQLQGDDGKCLTASSRKSGASVKSEYCSGRREQLWQRIRTEEGEFSGFTGKLKLHDTDLCLDALGGSKFMDGVHQHWGIYTCKDSKNQNLYFQNQDESIIMLQDNEEFEALDDSPVCLMYGGKAMITTYQDDDIGCDFWEKKGAGPSPAPAPTPSPPGKGKCDIRKPPKEQGAKSCNSKYNDADGYNPECSDNGRCQVCRKSTTSKRFHGNNWHNFCMDPIDE